MAGPHFVSIPDVQAKYDCNFCLGNFTLTEFRIAPNFLKNFPEIEIFATLALFFMNEKVI